LIFSQEHNVHLVIKGGDIKGLKKLKNRLAQQHTHTGGLVVVLPVHDNERLLAQNLLQSLQQHFEQSKQPVVILAVWLASESDCHALQTPEQSPLAVVCASATTVGEPEQGAGLHVAAALVGELGYDVLYVTTGSACTADVLHTVTQRSEDLLVVSKLSAGTAESLSRSVFYIRSSSASAQLLREQADNSSSNNSNSSRNTSNSSNHSSSSSSGSSGSSSSSWTNTADQLQLSWGLFNPLTVMQGYDKLSSKSPLLEAARKQQGVELALVVSPDYSELGTSARAHAQQAFLQREGLWHLERAEQAAAADVRHSAVTEEPDGISPAVLHDVTMCRQLDAQGLVSSAAGGGQCSSSSGVSGNVTLTSGEHHIHFAVQLSSDTPLQASAVQYQLQLVLGTAGVVLLHDSAELEQQQQAAKAAHSQQSAAAQYTAVVHVATDYTAYLLQGPAVITLELLQAGESLLRCVMCKPTGSSSSSSSDSLTVASSDAGSSDSAAAHLWDIVEVQDGSSTAAGSAQRKDLSREAAIEQGCYVPYVEPPRTGTAEKRSKQRSKKKKTTTAAGRGSKKRGGSSSSVSSSPSNAMQKLLGSKQFVALRKAAAALTAGVIAAAVIRALAAFAVQH
jgi:hypothetical protein